MHLIDNKNIYISVFVCSIKFKFQLNAQYFIPIVMPLYMFRAPLRPSLGGPLYIYSIWFYVNSLLVTVQLEG